MIIKNTIVAQYFASDETFNLFVKQKEDATTLINSWNNRAKSLDIVYLIDKQESCPNDNIQWIKDRNTGIEYFADNYNRKEYW